VKPLAFAAAAFILGACNAGTSQGVPSVLALRPISRSHSSPISHIVLIVQENRTFNNLFATFPGTVGTTTGKELVGGKVKSINLTEVPLESPKTLRHTYTGYRIGYNGGQMDGFNLIRGGTAIDPTESLIDDPDKTPWGCPAPPGTTTELITTTLKYERHGPPPCTSDFPSSGNYDTLQELLDAKHV
jgi:hypothetical protein